MKTRVKEEPREPEVNNVCKHHWVIGPADGTTSIGVCKVCKARMEFYNSLTGSLPIGSTPLFDLPVLVDVDQKLGK